MNNTKQYVVQYYKNEKEIDERKIADIKEIYKTAFSLPPWNYKPSALREEDIDREIRFALYSSTGTIITVEDEGRVIGFRIVSKMVDIVSHADSELKQLLDQFYNWISAFPEKTGYTQILGIHPDHAGNGVATTLVQEHLKYAVNSDCDYVLGWTLEDNAKMIKIYQNNGYVLINNLEISQGIAFHHDENENPQFCIDGEIGKVTYYLKDLRDLKETKREN